MCRRTTVLHWSMVRVVLCFIVLPLFHSGSTAALPSPNQPPLGWTVLQHGDVPGWQLIEFEHRLGIKLKNVSNTLLEKDGKRIQVNVASCESDEDAAKLQQKFLALHDGHAAYVLREGTKVVEFAKAGETFVLEARRELGYGLEGIERADAVYEVSLVIAPTASGPDMLRNRLMNDCWALRSDESNAAALDSLNALLAKFQFDSTLCLRNVGQGAAGTTFEFDPPSLTSNTAGATECRTFDRVPLWHGLPVVKARARITVAANALTPDPEEPGPELKSQTPYWPVESPEIAKLAGDIAGGLQAPRDKTNALLAWLFPGKHIRYAGDVTGSRYGVLQVLSQGYGHCWDFADLFVTLARAAGVPAREVGGWYYEKEGHVWTEVYLGPEEGWLAVDPTAGAGCNQMYVPIWTTEDGRMPILYIEEPKITAVSKG